MMIAADIVGEGHYTAYPSDKETHALQIPLKDGEMPKRSVLYKGVCNGTVRPASMEWLARADQHPLKVDEGK